MDLSRSFTNATAAADLQRLCAVSEGGEGVLRLAAWLAEEGFSGVREDIEMSNALGRLRAAAARTWDVLVLSPDGGHAARIPSLQAALLAEAVKVAPRVVVLLPSEQGADIIVPSGVEVWAGPPFTAVVPIPLDDPSIADTGPALSFWQRLRGREPARVAPKLPEDLRVMALHPLCAGASAFASLLAQELHLAAPDLRLSLIDLDVQAGGLSCYLDAKPSPAVLEFYRRPQDLDGELFAGCLQELRPNLHLFPAPTEILPLDALDPATLVHLVSHAQRVSDLVLIDLPPSYPDWLEAAFAECDLVLCTAPLAVRATQNLARLRRLMAPDMLHPDRYHIVLSQLPARPNRAWRERHAHFLRALPQAPILELPMAGDALLESLETGVFVADIAPREALRVRVCEFAGHLLASLAKRPSQLTQGATLGG